VLTNTRVKIWDLGTISNKVQQPKPTRPSARPDGPVRQEMP